MSSTELLASKIVILEEEPSIPAITALPSAVCLALGVTERGPIGDRTLVTSFEEYYRYFGGFTANSQVAIAAWGFFQNGGSFMWVSRTVHYTNINSKATATATRGSRMLQTPGTADSPATLVGTGIAPYNIPAGSQFDISVDGAPAPPGIQITGTQASIVSTGIFPLGAPLIGGETMDVTIAGANGGDPQPVTAAGGEQTEADFINLLSAQLKGCQVADDGVGNIALNTDRNGNGARIQVTDAGTLNASLGFPLTLSSGTGNVSDDDAITQLEIDAIIEAAFVTLEVIPQVGGTCDVQTVALGAAHSVQVLGTTTAIILTELGWDTDLHEGADDVPEDTLLIEGKTMGAYANDLQVVIAAASSGVASEFNLQVIEGGVVKEVFPNLTMGDGITPDLSQTNYVERVVNNENSGSNLIQVTDQLLSYSAANKRPANGTSLALTGGGDGLVGLADIDYIGSLAGGTGLYAFDQVSGGRILIVPGNTSTAVMAAMVTYAEVHRNGSMFVILDCPLQYTAAQMVAWMNSAALTELTEFAAVYWPRIKIANPDKEVFGDDDYIAVPTSGYIAGKYAANDQKLGGVYEQPAGIGGGYGILRGIVGIEDDPTGGSEHEVLDEVKRDLIAPQRINPITKLENTTWHIDGGDTLKSTGNFPHIGERRGVIYIEQTIKSGLTVLKHRANNKENRRMANRIVTAFLMQEMRKGAFRSNVPSEAFFVDTSDQLNPASEVFAGKMTIRIGLATNKPAKFIIIKVTQDTRELSAELGA